MILRLSKHILLIYLVLSKGSFYECIEKLSITFGRLCAACLKLNYSNFIFGLKYIPYLGYVITQGGAKPYMKKVQGILYVGRPTTRTKVRALIVVVQYYRDMFPRRSHILAPLKEAASGPKGRKIIWDDVLE